MADSPDDAPTLWPARHVAEHAYCPRLFYYMQVEGVFVPSADTEQGRFTHRRVDRPSLVQPPDQSDRADAEAPDDPERPRAVRSLTLASQRLGLIATLDLTELTGQPHAGGVAIPIEYRKGHPHHLSLAGADAADETEPGQQPLARVEPWPTDRIHVGLQVLLLEDHGYHVPHAVLYYAAERRRLVLPVDDDLRQSARAELEAARRTAGGPRPLPLINDPKCPRCSLQPICLPDEIHHQRVQSAAAPGPEPFSPRRLWPLHDDGPQLIVHTEGARIGVHGPHLRITDRTGALVRDVPTATLDCLAIVGHVQISTQALHLLADQQVPIVFMSAAGRAVAWVDPPGPVSAHVRCAQVRRFSDPAVRLELGRALVAAKIINQRTLLMRNADSLPPGLLQDMADQARAAALAPSLEALLGHEGQASALYFQCFAQMLRHADLAARFSQEGRRRRPPPDPVNSLLSFAYTMLVHEATAALRTASLDPAIGAYHALRRGRPALALDLMEPFRPLIADSVVISLINRAEIGPGHFLDTAVGCALTPHGRKAFFDAWGRRMATEVTHPVFEYRLSYRRMLMLHARLIAAWLLGEAPTLAFLTTR